MKSFFAFCNRLLASCVIPFILLWTYALGPIFSGVFGQQCRFEPSCSRYAAEAFRRHGFMQGSFLTLKRLFRCRPGVPGGFDPVP